MAGPERRGVYSRIQAVIIVILVAGLIVVLYSVEHRSLSSVKILPGKASDYAFRPDVNAAKWEELSLVPGLGPKKAKAIVEYRKAGGRFKCAEDLEAVPGIGKKTAADIAQYIRFGNQ